MREGAPPARHRGAGHGLGRCGRVLTETHRRTGRDDRRCVRQPAHRRPGGTASRYPGCTLEGARSHPAHPGVPCLATQALISAPRGRPAEASGCATSTPRSRAASSSQPWARRRRSPAPAPPRPRSPFSVCSGATGSARKREVLERRMGESRQEEAPRVVGPTGRPSPSHLGRGERKVHQCCQAFTTCVGVSASRLKIASRGPSPLASGYFSVFR
jgi:hypothetical protein